MQYNKTWPNWNVFLFVAAGKWHIYFKFLRGITKLNSVCSFARGLKSNHTFSSESSFSLNITTNYFGFKYRCLISNMVLLSCARMWNMDFTHMNYSYEKISCINSVGKGGYCYEFWIYLNSLIYKILHLWLMHVRLFSERLFRLKNLHRNTIQM